jgi:hypothetical protein
MRLAQLWSHVRFLPPERRRASGAAPDCRGCIGISSARRVPALLSSAHGDVEGEGIRFPLAFNIFDFFNIFEETQSL